MKRILVCLTALLILAALVGCGGNDVTESGSPTPPTATPTATPTSVPTATPTPAPLTFQDLLDKSETEEVVVNIYPLIMDGLAYPYYGHRHRLYIKDGQARMTVYLDEISNNYELIFDSITYVDSCKTQYHPDTLDLFTQAQKYQPPLSTEYANVYSLLSQIKGAYVLSLEEPYSFGHGDISQVMLYQKDDTVYVLFKDSNDLTISIKTAMYEDNTFASLESDRTFADVLNSSHEEVVSTTIPAFAQSAGLSSLLRLEIKIENGIVYHHNRDDWVKQPEFVYTENFSFIYDHATYIFGNNSYGSLNYSSLPLNYGLKLMDYLETLPNCYLAMNETKSWAQAVYQVGDTFYYLVLGIDDNGQWVCSLVFETDFKN